MSVESVDGAADPLGLRARVDQLELAIVARDRFIAAVGHELRNTMAPLALLVESVSMSSDPAVLARRMDMLARNLKQLSATLDRVQDVAQLRSEKLVLTREPVDLSEVARTVVAERAEDALAANVELQLDAPASVVGNWDRSRVRQITSHLVSNAVRHSGGGPVEVSVRNDDAHAILDVADRGRGIEESRRARLFDAFDFAEPKRGAGLGVGLWIVHTLCQKLEGSVALVADHAPGARFRVALPRV